MSDPNDRTEVDLLGEDGDPVEEGVRAVYPKLDGEGGTIYVYGDSDEEATFEEWAAQNSVAVPEEAPVEDDPDE